ncbi:hypothetical protein CWI38_1008p0020 [Hamiltosporidium tvaerminnensis]|uniref:Uncharacterized protein n=1 Tax=Hamiltosporidium tvaerminnensis TaxID=1176355 RepID=A0A4Q9LU56_9MICR|nr:hypothetical protein CWI38_1008p0020 [Hamiltosporidium tvaerminnensis]
MLQNINKFINENYIQKEIHFYILENQIPFRHKTSTDILNNLEEDKNKYFDNNLNPHNNCNIDTITHNNCNIDTVTHNNCNIDTITHNTTHNTDILIVPLNILINKNFYPKNRSHNFYRHFLYPLNIEDVLFLYNSNLNFSIPEFKTYFYLKNNFYNLFRISISDLLLGSKENKDIKENGKDREEYSKDIEENKDIKENGKDREEYSKDIEENKDREVYGKDIEENMKDIEENKDRDENRKDIRNINNSKEYSKNIEENSKDREVYCKDKKHNENIYNTHKSTDNTDTYKNEEKDVFELKKLLDKKLIYQIFKKKADFNRKTENILGILICVSIYDKFINFKKLFEMKTVFVFSCFNPYFYSFLSDNKTLMDFVDYKNNLRDNFVIIRIKKIEGLNKESSGRLVKSVKCNGIRVNNCVSNIGGVNYRSSNIEGVNYIVVMKGVLSICSSESVSNNTITKSVLVAIY